MSGGPAPQRGDYRWFCAIDTRWHDNDIYGHINNVAYYAYFDTAANRYLIKVGGLDIRRDPVVAFIVSSHCQFHHPAAFPQRLEVGLRVDRLGPRSVHYGLAVFPADGPTAHASGGFVHVFVDRESGRAAPIPQPLASALRALARETPDSGAR